MTVAKQPASHNKMEKILVNDSDLEVMDWSTSKSVATVGRVIRPRKIGLVLKPPSLILLYDDLGGKKLRKRSMPLRFQLKASTDPRAKAEEVKLRHLSYLDTVPTVILTKLIAIAQEVEAGLSLSKAVEAVNSRFTVNAEKDLNRVSERELRIQKDIMELTFLTNAIDVSHPSFVYDKQVFQNL